MPIPSPRLQLPVPLGVGDGSDVPHWFGLWKDILDNAAIYTQGTLAQRPISTVPAPGVKGRLHYVTGDGTAINNGILWLDTGTAWVETTATSFFRSAVGVIKTNDVLAGASDVYSRQGLAGQVNLGLVGTAAGVLFGLAGDVDIYRFGPDVLKTDDAMVATLGYSIGSPLPGVPAYQSQQVAAQTVLRNKLLAADANDAFNVLGDGKHQWGAGGGTALDTDLYRSAAAVLKTNGAFSAGPITTNAAGGGGQAGTYVGSGGNVGTTRVAAGQVYGVSLTADVQYRFTIQHDGALAWGPGGATAPDTDLYRALADVLKTDDTFQSALNVYARAGAATQAVIGTAGPGGEAGLLFGSAGDASFYRSAAGALKTDGTIQFTGHFRALSATKIAAYSITATDDVVVADATAGAFTVTLPAAAGRAGRVYTVLNIGTANNITIAVQVGDSLGGTLNGTTVVTINNKASFVAVGTGWRGIET